MSGSIFAIALPLIFVGGVLRYEHTKPHLPTDAAAHFNDGPALRVRGVLRGDPSIGDTSQQFTIDLREVQLGDDWQHATGGVLVRTGVLPPREFARWSIEPTRRIVEGVREKVPDARIIGFPRGAGALLPSYVDTTGIDAVSIDWAAEPSLIRERVQTKVAVQGNLDPLALIAGGAALDRAIDDVLANYASGRLIFNLGHGILPETPIAHVERMLKRVREYRG